MAKALAQTLMREMAAERQARARRARALTDSIRRRISKSGGKKWDAVSIIRKFRDAGR